MAGEAIRDGFGKALSELGEKNPKVVVLSGDLEDSTRALDFKKRWPERFWNMGIAEQDMIGTAVGLALSGKIAFATSFAVFLNRAIDHIRISVCYNNANVKIVGSHGGLTTGEDGATAQALEDIAIFRALPNMVVVVPCDAEEARKATLALAEHQGPAYIRLGRPKVPTVTGPDTPFTLGKANLLRDGSDVAIFACGAEVNEALSAAETLAKEKISAAVADIHTIKPIDEETITALAKKCGCAVTAEEHQVSGGFGSAVAEVLARGYPVPVEMVAVKDTFGESGDGRELMIKYHIAAADIVRAAKTAIKRKEGK